MGAVSVSRKVSSTKNLVEFHHSMPAGKTLFSVVSYYLTQKIAKYLVHLCSISYTVKIVLLWKNFLLFRKKEMPLAWKPENIHHFFQNNQFSFPIKLIKVSYMRVHSSKNQPGFAQRLFSF